MGIAPYSKREKIIFHRGTVRVQFVGVDDHIDPSLKKNPLVVVSPLRDKNVSVLNFIYNDNFYLVFKNHSKNPPITENPLSEGFVIILLIKRDKVDTFNGTSLGAFAAACAFVVIYLSAEVLDLNCAEFARLDALHTADTAV